MGCSVGLELFRRRKAQPVDKLILKRRDGGIGAIGTEAQSFDNAGGALACALSEGCWIEV